MNINLIIGLLRLSLDRLIYIFRELLRPNLRIALQTPAPAGATGPHGPSVPTLAEPTCVRGHVIALATHNHLMDPDVTMIL